MLVGQDRCEGARLPCDVVLCVYIPGRQDKRTLDELGLSDGDRMAAEKEAKKGYFDFSV